MENKILVTSPGQQHSYRLAIALKNKNLLQKYITTVYNKPYSLTRFISCFLKGDLQKRALNRHSDFIDNNDVKLVGEFIGLLEIFGKRFLPKKIHKLIFEFRHLYFEWKVARYAIKKKVFAIVAYDTNASFLFPYLKKKAPSIKRILDISSAMPQYCYNIFEKDFSLAPAFANSLKIEAEREFNPILYKNAQIEIDNSDYFLTPSSFVEKSLLCAGAKESQFLRCPYGVDIKQFNIKSYNKTEHYPIKFVYVGGVKERKGIYYLLEAFKQISIDKATLTVVGDFNPADENIKPYLNFVKFTGNVLHEEIPNILQSSDVFIFPSLKEGLSLSTLEAAACGLPLIVSENSGVNDLLTEGQEGFIIPIQNVNAIVEKINWFIENPNKIEIIGRNARKLAEKYSWERYYKNIGDVFEKILDKKIKK